LFEASVIIGKEAASGASLGVDQEGRGGVELSGILRVSILFHRKEALAVLSAAPGDDDTLLPSSSLR
jgi:hypothetical protein